MRLQKVLPDIHLSLAGDVLSQAWSNALEQIVVEQKANTPSLCELHFLLDKNTEHDFAIATSLSVEIGRPARSLFEGEITARRTQYLPNGQKRVTLTAEDRLHHLNKNQPIRQFTHNMLSEWMGDVLNEYSLTLEDFGDPVWLNYVFQWAQTDLQQMVSTLNRYGLHGYLHQSTFQIFDLQLGSEAHTLTLADTLLSAEVIQSASTACRSVTSLHWNPVTAAIQTHRQNADELPNANVAEGLSPAQFGLEGNIHLAGLSFHDADDANHQARAVLAHRLAEEHILKGIAEGDTQLTPGKRIALENVDTDHVRDFVLTQCRHTFTRAQGYLTEISSQPPPQLKAPTLASTIAEVVAIDDPDNRGRIQVTYPALNQLRSDWLAVLFPAAGKNKGLFMLPDVGDLVLVQFIGGDLTQGVVAGGLYGEQAPPDSKNKNGHCQIYRFITGRGQQLQLDDNRGAVTLKNRGGSYLDLAPGKVTLFANTDMTIEAPGKSLVIKAHSIDFEQG